MTTIALPTLLQIVQKPFFVWVTLNEHKWVILGERRRVPHHIEKAEVPTPVERTTP